MRHLPLNQGGYPATRDVSVWDPLVRLIHWSVALSMLLNATIIDEESALHEWIGYVALGLVGVRLIWALIGPRHARFSAFPPSLGRARRHLAAILGGERTIHLSHNPLGALMVYNLWLSIIAIGVTGFMLTTDMFFGVGWVKELHELIFTWTMLSAGLHVGGVVFDTRRSGVNLVRSMIRGTKAIPEGRETE